MKKLTLLFLLALMLVAAQTYWDGTADVNDDGKVNGTDIQEVINIIVNAE